jgi:iron complex outermembrane recepter protein
MADANGNVRVVPGNRIPGLPLNQGKLGIYFSPTPEWTIGADMAIVGSSYFVGDDANQNPKLPGYWLVNLHATYQLTKEVQLFGLINNLFNRRYALFGTFFDPESVANVGLPIVLTDHRTEVRGPPLAVYGGISLTF